MNPSSGSSSCSLDFGMSSSYAIHCFIEIFKKIVEKRSTVFVFFEVTQSPLCLPVHSVPCFLLCMTIQTYPKNYSKGKHPPTLLFASRVYNDSVFPDFRLNYMNIFTCIFCGIRQMLFWHKSLISDSGVTF
jgi:hypothetical protein